MASSQQSISVEKKIQIIRALSNDMAGFLHTLPEDVWRDADVYASACDQWNMADVVAHLIDVANTFTLSIERAVTGNVSPPMGNRRLTSEEWVQSIISLRDAYGEDLFPEFNTACLRFNRLIMDLKPDQYELPAWHPFRVMTVERLIDLRDHGARGARLGRPLRHRPQRSDQPGRRPVPEGLGEQVAQSQLPPTASERPRCQTALHPHRRRSSRTTSQSAPTTSRSTSSDQSAEVDATLELDSSSYILFLMGRLPLRRSVRRGRITLDGDQDLAEQFPNWFPGV